jgi:small-conductance mechanosensitive channel
MNTAANTAQNVWQGALDTWLSLLQKLYDNPFVHGLISLLIALLLSVILIIISKIVAAIVRNRISKTFAATQGDSMKKMWVLIWDIVFYAMSFLSIYISFSVVGIDIGLLMWGITIWVGFAFRQTLSNMVSGIVIFSTDEYKLGNIVEMKIGGDTLYGVIEEVNMKNVILRSFDMRKIVIPNENFLKQSVRAYRPEEDFLRIEISAPVDVSLDINTVLQQTLEQLNTYAFILKKEYNQVLVDSFDDKHVKLKVTFFYNPTAGYPAEVLKSVVQANLLELYKKMTHDAKALEKKVV